jgi:hypothetical protein
MRTFSDRRTGRTTRRPPCLGCDDDRRRAGAIGHGHQLLDLQRSVGNGAVVAMVSQAQRLEDDEYDDDAPSTDNAPQPEAAPESDVDDGPQAGESAEVEPSEDAAAPEQDAPEAADDTAEPEQDTGEPEQDAAEPEQAAAEPEQEAAADDTAEPLPPGPFFGDETEVEVEGRAFTFKGKTTAKYAHSWDHANDVVNGNVRSGDLVETYSVATNVSLPSAPKGLSECEANIVDDAINTKLANHEQAHVDAFHNNYDGTVTTSYSETGNAAQVTAKLEAKHQANKAARQAKADHESALLDPFQIDVDTTPCDKTSMNETAPGGDDNQTG